jgi:hypothetical protein
LAKPSAGTLANAGCRELTAFFIPGVSDDPGLLEETYGDMLSQIERDLGSRPSARRILRLWSRRGRVDCIAEVGCADPVRGGTVMAIFDMGPHRPFVVWRQSDDRVRAGVREVLACHAYAVSEFDQ